MSDRQVATIWIGVFATVTTFMWAIAAINIYAPPSPVRSAKQLCALYEGARNTPFCMEIAKNGGE